MDLVASEKNFTIVIAALTFVAFWAIWIAMTWKPPIESRLKALRTRRMKTRSEQSAAAKPSSKSASLGVMRKIADRLNLLRGSAADQTTRKLRQAGFLSRDAAVVYVFIKLALPLTLGFVMIGLTSATGVIDVPDNLIAPVCIGAVLAGFVSAGAFAQVPPTAAEPGRWQTSRTPYLREIMDHLSASSAFERVVLQKGIQIGATEAGAAARRMVSE